ncbi:antirestriction protein ArdA [Streptomyces catenulae]|uniref:Antirestriction protein ArdA n=1 Tax=Streptomyces catenulae TaxID=66875 RepID=A0ABV2YTB4_9ACTN|nr:antirestriction protein ArdA [Streptomyces catenulae]
MWIGCLACYNAGRLVGDWYEADAADLVSGGDLHGRPTDHDELWVMDHENFLGAIVGECSPHHAAKIAKTLREILPYEHGPFAAWFSEYGDSGDDLAEDLERFRDEFRGQHDSEADFARVCAEEVLIGEEQQLLARWPFNGIDWDRAAVELFSGAYCSIDAPGGGVYVFDIG